MTDDVRYFVSDRVRERCLAVAAGTSLWLLSTRLLSGVVIDILGSVPFVGKFIWGFWMIFVYPMLFLSAAAIIALAALAVARTLLGMPRPSRGLGLVTGLILLAQAAAVVAPVGDLPDRLEFVRQRTTREQIAQSILDGSLRATYSPTILPYLDGSWTMWLSRPVPASVSIDRQVRFWPHGDAVEVVFSPYGDALGTLSNRTIVRFIYSSNGASPHPPEHESVLSVERVDERWYIVRSRPS